MMPKRFIWNFEIDTQNALDMRQTSDDLSDLHWEFRHFWQENEIITLSRLNENFLNLSHYRIKYKTDVYYLLPQTNYNIKMRNEHYFYKPILGKTVSATAYGKKINLSELHDHDALPGIPDMNKKALLESIKIHAKKIMVEKEALIHRFDCYPKVKFELAKLRIAKHIYYSVSIESPSLAQVNFLTQQWLGNITSCDYTTFLKAR